jgi:hypothetical protein
MQQIKFTKLQSYEFQYDLTVIFGDIDYEQT